VEAGKIRSIGISNFTIEETKKLLQTAKIPPAANQIEAHPYLLQPDLFKFLKDNVSHGLLCLPGYVPGN
jgi:L-glyceraldehyde reductase